MSVEALISANYSSETSIVGDVRHALELKTAWYRALGIPTSEQPLDFLSFEPWLERAKYERLLKATLDLSPQQKEELINRLKQEEDVQLITNLRERYSTGQNTTTFIIVNGKLRPFILPDEDFEGILRRGLEYRRQNGSKELVREESEVEGFIKIQGQISKKDTPIGTRIISLSAPGITKGTSYQKRFVDIWEVKQNEQGGKYAEETRFTAGLDYEGYRKSALKLTPDYFDEGSNTLPIDAYFLSHPVTLPPQEQIGSLEDLYEAFFERDFRVMAEKRFQELLQLNTPFRRYFIDQLVRESIDWVEFAKAFNAILAISDRFLEEKANIVQSAFVGSYTFPTQQLSLADQVAFYGMQQVRTISGGCGISAGFNLKNRTASILQIFGNSVAKFGIEVKGGVCQECGSASDGHYHCPNCNKEYADETNVAPENRTKQCGCGFKFGC